MTDLKTFIKWQGNKSKHYNKFEKWLPDYDQYNRYIEPFLGSGAVFLKIEPENWIINDLNKDNINMWRTVRDEPEYLIKGIKKFGNRFKRMSRENKVKYCRKKTYEIPDMEYDEERALTYMLMTSCCFGGNILRNDKFYYHGLELNINKDKYPFMSKNSLKNITEVSYFLNNSKGKIYNCDYKKVLKKTKEGDFVFMDPPYVEDHDYNFNYNKGENLDNLFLSELLEECKKLDEKGVMWMMTQADTKEVRKIFKGYKFKKFKAYRLSIKDYVNELVIMNY